MVVGHLKIWIFATLAFFSSGSLMADDYSLQRQQMLAEKRLRLTNAIRVIIEAERNRLAVLAAGLQAVSPLDTLKRGYAIVENQQGQLVRSVADLKTQEEIVGRLADGRFKAVVRKILND